MVEIVKNLPYNAGDPGSTSELGRSPGEKNGNPLHYSCLEDPMSRGTWLAIVHEVAKSHTELSTRKPVAIGLSGTDIWTWGGVGESGKWDVWRE